MKTFRCTVDVEVDGVDDMPDAKQQEVVASIVKQRVGLYATAPISVVVIGEVSVWPTYMTLTDHLPIEETKRQMNAHGRVSGVVPMALEELIDLDLEGLLDYLSELLIGSPLLMDVSYGVVGATPEGEFHVRVSGDASVHLKRHGDEGDGNG
jgi:hypothetical protein